MTTTVDAMVALTDKMMDYARKLKLSKFNSKISHHNQHQVHSILSKSTDPIPNRSEEPTSVKNRLSITSDSLDFRFIILLIFSPSN